jgi:hypothetical protein
MRPFNRRREREKLAKAFEVMESQLGMLDSSLTIAEQASTAAIELLRGNPDADTRQVWLNDLEQLQREFLPQLRTILADYRRLLAERS